MKSKYLLFADGNSVHTLKWAQELKKHFDVYILTLTSCSPEVKALLGCDKIHQMKILLKSDGGNAHTIAFIYEAYKIINFIKPKFINAHYVTSYGFIATLIKKIFRIDAKVILSCWGTDILVTPYKNKAYWYITKFALLNSSFITSDSFFMSDVIKKISGRSAITFPFGLERFPKEIQLNNKDNNLFFSNRAMEVNYNIDGVINHFAKIYRKNSQAKLIIANHGSEKNKLATQIKQLGLEKGVEFVGYLKKEEQNKFYKEALFYYSIPYSDSTSVSLMEAMAYGCIPIVSNIPANREWILEGANGYFTESSICFEMEEAINQRGLIFSLNREIILRRAIWSQNISEFIREVN